MGMSALLSTTRENMKSVIAALRQSGLRDKVKVIIGGSPVTKEYATEIGADGTAADAIGAVDLAKMLMGGRPTP